MAVIMIVEDDRQTNDAVSEYLKSLGHRMFSAYDGDEALQIFLEKRYDDFKSRITSKCRNLLNCPDICCGEGGN